MSVLSTTIGGRLASTRNFGRASWRVGVVSLIAAVAVPILGASSAGATSPVAPSAPTAVSAVGSYEKATIDWTVGTDGNDPITAFVITPYIGGDAGPSTTYPAGAVGSPLDPTPGATDSVVYSPLPLGTGYTFTIAAINAVDTGAASGPTNPVNSAVSAPSAATAPTATAGAGSATVRWTVPASNGSAITTFAIEPYLSGVAQAPTPEQAGAVGSALDPTPGATDSATVSNLTNGDSYTFSITTFNGVGIGLPSPQSNAITISAPAVAVIDVSPNTNDFGDVTLGDISAGQSFTFVNGGPSPAEISNLDFGGADPDDFVLTQTSDCQGDVIQPGYSCSVNLAFLPGAAGARSATVTAVDGSSNPPVITLTGTGSEGYFVGAANGNVEGLGDAPDSISGDDQQIAAPIVSVVSTGDDGGFWLADTLGNVYDMGDAQNFGDLGAVKLNKPIVGMAATPDGGGYWLVASDGGIFSFGDAQFYGSTGGIKLNKPIVGIASTPDGGGYWMVASDGGIFAFGDAPFYGSTGGIHLNQPIVGMAATPDGSGYWLVASDGGIFAFGDAPFHGSTGNIKLNKPIVGMAATADGGGYWMVASDGGIFSFGDAPFEGSASGQLTNVIGMSITGASTFQATVDIPAERSLVVQGALTGHRIER